MSTCDVLTVFFHWVYKMNTSAIKSLLLFMAGLFIGFLVEKCVACQNSVIRFLMASFSFFTLLNAEQALKVSSNYAFLDSFQELNLE